MTTITVWHMDVSTPSWVVRMMADILGLKVELKNINLPTREHKTLEFRKINPMGTIPVIKDGDFILSDSHTIMKYLLDKYGNEEQKRMYPSDRKLRALVDQALFFDTGVAFIRVKNILLPAFFERHKSISPKLLKETEDVYETVEIYLAEHYFIATNEFTIADLSVGATIISLDDVIPVSQQRYPRTTAWLKKLRSMPVFQKIAVPGSKALSNIIGLHWEKNKSS